MKGLLTDRAWHSMGRGEMAMGGNSNSSGNSNGNGNGNRKLDKHIQTNRMASP
jgi:hypothetical protein